MDDELLSLMLMILKYYIFFFLDPIWCTVHLHVYYTNLYTFASNFTFWHFYCINFFVGPFILGSRDGGEFDFVWLALLVIPPIWFLKTIDVWSKNRLKAKIQTLEQVQNGILGMSLTTLTLLGCIFAYELEFNYKVIRLIALVSTLTLMYSYYKFSSISTRLYIRLPEKQRPYTLKPRLYVLILGILHLYLAIIAFNFSKLTLLLVISSFTFTVDAYSLLTTTSYLICEHRQFSENLREPPVNGVICHVAIRRYHEKMKVPDESLPGDFVYDDEIKLDPKWLKEDGLDFYFIKLCREYILRKEKQANASLQNETSSNGAVQQQGN